MKPDLEQSERHENAQEDRGAGIATRPDRVAPAGAALDAVCRSVAQLAGSTPHPPLRIRMQDGQTTVEVEWPDRVRNGRPPADEPRSGDAHPDGPPLAEADELSYVRAPMVGTFYHAGSPDDRPYVAVGDVVLVGQAVGVVEAMKMMNTITAEATGRVVEILTPNAHPVEFDQRLIALEPVDEDTVDRP